MSKTLDEFIAKYSAVSKLEENLAANIEVFCPKMSDEERETLLRMNMIMVRECLLDFGAE